MEVVGGPPDAEQSQEQYQLSPTASRGGGGWHNGGGDDVADDQLGDGAGRGRKVVGDGGNELPIRSTRGGADHSDHSPTSSSLLLGLLTFIAGLGGFLFGYDTGVIAGALLLVRRQFELSDSWQAVVVAGTPGAAAVGSLVCGGLVVDRAGRRPVLLVGSAVFAVGAAVLAAAKGPGGLLVGRIVVGVAIGMVSVTVPIYISESSPAKIRGTLVTMFQVNIVIGMFIAVTIGAFFSYDQEDGWRYMFGVSALPAIIQFIGVLFLPESPRWLVAVDQTDKAQAVLERLRGHSDVQAELAEITDTCLQEKELAALNKAHGSILIRMVREGPVCRALLIGCGLQMFQQIIGINTVMYYSATIIQMGGITEDSTAIWLASATSSINVVFTFAGIYLIDKLGRRPLLLGSLCGVLLSLIILASGFLVMTYTTQPVTLSYNSSATDYPACSQYSWCDECVRDPGCGFCSLGVPVEMPNSTCLPTIPGTSEPQPGLSDLPSLVGVQVCEMNHTRSGGTTWRPDVCTSYYGWVVVVGMAFYLAAFATGMGSVPWTLNAELYPLWARGTGCALATATNWTFNLIISITFLALVNALTPQGAFLLYGCFALLGFVFTYVLVPETKRLTLEGVEQLFHRGQEYEAF